MTGVTAKVLFEYIAEQEDELTIRMGDIITNVIQEDGGWWNGEVNGKTGMFPENFVSIVRPPSSSKPEVKAQSASIGKPLSSSKPEVKAQSASKAEVLFDYDQVQSDELALVKGTIIEIIETPGDGWWKGRYNGKEGLFPANFVVMEEVPKLSEPIPKPLPFPDTEHVKQLDNDTKTPQPQQSQSKIASMFGAITSGDLSRTNLKKVPHGGADQKPDEQALEASINQTEAAKPTQLVQPMHVDGEKENKKPPMMPSSPGTKKSTKPLQKAIALFDYEPELADELKLRIGDKITVINSELTFEGWMKGEVDGNIGIFPENFVELLPEEDCEQPGGQPVKEEPVQKPQQGIPMLPPGGKPLQNELAKKLAQRSSVIPGNNLAQSKKGNKAPPPPLPGAKPSLPSGTKPKPMIPHHKPVKPPLQMAKQVIPSVDTKPHGSNQPILKNDTKPTLPKNEQKLPANITMPVLPKNEDDPPALPKTDNRHAVQMFPKNDAKLSTPANKSPSVDELKPETNQLKNVKEDIEPVLPKCQSTSSMDRSPSHSNSQVRRSLRISGSEADSVINKSATVPNINKEIKKEDDLNTADDYRKITGSPSLQLSDVKPTDSLKHLQRAKPPSKSPPSKYKDKQPLEAPSNVVDNTKEVNELKSQITELQTKMADMEQKFKKFIIQVTDDISNEQKQRSNQQIEIDSLNKKLSIFLK